MSVPRRLFAQSVGYVLFVQLLAGSVGLAQSSWTGGGNNSQWSTGANWSPAGPPAAGPNLQLTFNNSNRLQNNQDMQAPPFAMNRLMFATGAGSFTINGPSRLRYDGTSPKLIQNTVNRQTIAADLELMSSSITIEGTGSADVVLSGRILPEVAASNAGLVKNGSFTLELTGSAHNTYGGLTVVNAGTLALNKSVQIDAIGSEELVVGDGVSTDRVRVMNNEQIPDTTVVTIGAGNGTLEIDPAKYETVRSLRSSSPTGGIVRLWNDSRLTTGGQAAEPFNGQFIGTQLSTVERHGGTAAGLNNSLVLGGSSPDFAGTLRVRSGGVTLSPGKQIGKQTAPFWLTVDNGAWFVGGGTIYVRRNTTNLPASFKDGSTLRLVEQGQGARQFTVRGDVLLEPGSTVKFELNGPQPGDGPASHSQLKVVGQITLAGSHLDFSAPVTPVEGHQYVLVDNDGSDLVQGTFVNHPEGHVFHWFDGSIWGISYRGGDGNDVVMTSYGSTTSGGDIPTVSEWGLAVLALSLLTLAKLRSLLDQRAA